MKKPNREFQKVSAQYTSQTCPNCGNVVKKSLSQRTHLCECGCILPRDVAAAQIILSRATFVKSYSVSKAEGARTYPTHIGKVKPGTAVGVDTVAVAPAGVDSVKSVRLIERIEPGISCLPLEIVTPLQLSIPLDSMVTGILPVKKRQKRPIKRNPSQTNEQAFTQLTLWESG